jgi:hypothetical protein
MAAVEADQLVEVAVEAAAILVAIGAILPALLPAGAKYSALRLNVHIYEITSDETGITIR